VPADFIIKTGDMIQITLAPTIVPPLLAPVPMVGTATQVLVSGTVACVLGDQVPPSVRGPLPYTEPPFVLPGTGTLEIDLPPANHTNPTNNGGTLIIIKGGTFPVRFNVQSPASDPSTGAPDPVPVKVGTAQFITSNALTKAG
jgi:hypothetical protein